MIGLVVAAMGLSACGEWPYARARSGRVLFEDTFSGTRLNTAKWQPNWLAGNNTTKTKPVNSREASCYDPAQVSVRGGSLRLRAVKRSCRANNGKTYKYASGLVNTRRHFTFTYGRVEARVFTSPGKGAIHNWPAVWANGTGTWPRTGELDVMEGLDGDACYHFHSNAGGPGGCARMGNHSGWHTFAAEWRKGSVTYIYDGRVVGKVTKGVTNAPMYLILNLGVSPSIAPPIHAPSQMLVDYIRVTKL
jgi:beta-glucanase (GH16 family)